MKQPLLILALLLFAGAAFAQTNVKIGEKVTSADTVQVQVKVPNFSMPSTRMIYIQVDPTNSGTIQFSVGEVINDDFYAWPAGSRIPITIQSGRNELRYKASGAGQSFVITQ